MGASVSFVWILLVGGIVFTWIFGGLIVLLVRHFKKGANREASPESEEDRRAKKVGGWISAGVILLSAAAWVMNMGWVRFGFIMLPPLMALLIAHAVFLFLVMRKSAPLARKIPSVRWQRIAACAAYFIFYAFLPDGGDYGGSYMFFMLIRNETAISIGAYLAVAAVIADIILLCLLAARVKKAAAETAAPPITE